MKKTHNIIYLRTIELLGNFHNDNIVVSSGGLLTDSKNMVTEPFFFFNSKMVVAAK